RPFVRIATTARRLAECALPSRRPQELHSMKASNARAAGAALVLSCLIAACSTQPNETATASQPLLSGPHRVQVSGNASAQLLQQGGKLIADYGTFALIDADGAKINALPRGTWQLRDEYRQILLNAGGLDALDPASARMRETALPASGRQLHLVQFAGAMRNEWYARLQGSGVQVVAYVPHNAYLVYGDAASLSRLIAYAKGSPEVQWDGPYQDDFKINPRVFTFEKPDGYQVQLVEDAKGNADTLGRAAALDRKHLIDQRALGYVNLVVHTD